MIKLVVQDSVDEDIYELGVKKSAFSETVLASTTDGKPAGMPDEKVCWTTKCC